MNKVLIIGVVLVVAVVGTYFLFMTQPDSGVVVPPGQTPSQSPIVGSNTPTPPREPSTPTVETDPNTTSSSSTGVVRGKVNPQGAVTSYWYEYGKSSTLGSKTVAQDIGSGFALTPATAVITGLDANTQYFFRLVAQNSYGTVRGALYGFKTNTNPPPQGRAPSVSTGTPTDITRTSAKLHGQVNPNNSETIYWFEYGVKSTFGSTQGLQSIGSGGSLMDVVIALSDLKPATKYFIRLNAQNQFGTVNGSVQTFTTPGPPAIAPTARTDAATNIATSSATLNGQITPNGSNSTYWFEYSKDSVFGVILGTTVKQPITGGTEKVSVNAKITGLTSNTRYFYRLITENQYGISRGGIGNFRTKP